MRLFILLFITSSAFGSEDRLRDIAVAPSAKRVELETRAIAGFGTRHSLSETVSNTRGIGAGRKSRAQPATVSIGVTRLTRSGDGLESLVVFPGPFVFF